MAVGKRTRFEIFKRDGFQCMYCGKTPPQAVLECDHIHPVSLGGSDDTENLITSCEDCNRGKSNIPLESVSKTLIEQQQRQIELKQQFSEYNQFLEQQREVEDERVEQIGTFWFDSIKRKKSNLIFAGTRISSVRTFLRKLPFVEVKEAVELAISRKPCTIKNDHDTWKYFCGICWTKIKRLGGE